MTSLTPDQQREAYRRMLRIRKFEEDGTRLYKAGEIPGAYHASIGQAVETEVARAIEFGKRGPLPVAGDVYQYMYVNPINYPRPTWQVRT